MIFLGWSKNSKTRWYFLAGWSNKRRQGRPGSHLEVIEGGCRWYLGNIQNKDIIFSFGDRTKNGRVSLRGDREGLPVVRAAAKTMSGLVKPGKNPASNVEKYYCYLPRKISKSNNILDPVEILLRIKGGHCQIPAWSPIRLVWKTHLKRSKRKQN